MSLRNSPICLLNISSRDGDSTNSLGSTFQGSTHFSISKTVLSIRLIVFDRDPSYIGEGVYIAVTRQPSFPIPDILIEYQFHMVFLQYLFSHLSFLIMQLMMNFLIIKSLRGKKTHYCSLRVSEMCLQLGQRECLRCKIGASRKIEPLKMPMISNYELLITITNAF